MISTILLNNALPQVFAQSKNDEVIKQSQVWCEKVELSCPDYSLIEAESGTGKSSLCSFLYGKRSDYSGEILFNGEDIRTFTIERWCELRRCSLAYLPQEMCLFPELTALENVQIKNQLTDYKSEREIIEMFEQLEIQGKIGQPVAQLSIGQQQRVAIIRSLCQPFNFLILDEPVSHLDDRNNDLVSTLIDVEAKKQGAGVIATSVGNKINLPFEKLLNL